MFADRLKKSLLQAAIQGQLTEQLPTDGDARDLLRKIRTEKTKFIVAKKIKAEKPLPPVTDEEIPFDIPDNWCWVRLGDVCQINPRNKVEDENIDATFLSMTAINDGYSNGYNPLVKSWNEIRSGFTHFADGDVIFAKITPCFQNRKSAVVKGLTNGIGAGTTELYVLRSYGKYINEKYLLYFVKNQQFILDGMATMKGTAGQQRISRNFVINYLLPLPPFAEQKRIVEKLDALLSQVDELAKDERELVELEETFPRRMRNSLLQAAIQGKLTEQLPSDGNARDLLKKIRAEKVKLIAAKKIKAEKPLPSITDDEIPFDLPDNWCWCRLGEICNYGTNETISPDAMERGKLLVDLEDIEKDSGKLINKKLFDGNNANSSKNVFRYGQVLFGKLRVYLNKVIVADNNGYCSSEILPLDFGQNILSRYAQIVLMSPMFISYATACSYGTKMPRLGTTAGQLALFSLPPLSEQKRIVERLNELLPLCEI